MPGRQPGGLIVTTVIGIVGAAIAYGLARAGEERVDAVGVGLQRLVPHDLDQLRGGTGLGLRVRLDQRGRHRQRVVEVGEGAADDVDAFDVRADGRSRVAGLSERRSQGSGKTPG